MRKKFANEYLIPIHIYINLGLALCCNKIFTQEGEERKREYKFGRKIFSYIFLFLVHTQIVLMSSNKEIQIVLIFILRGEDEYKGKGWGIM